MKAPLSGKLGAFIILKHKSLVMYTVYRVEASDGKGPYSEKNRSGKRLTVQDLFAWNYHGNMYTHPNMAYDCPEVYYKSNYREYFCGFLTKRALISWFPPADLQILIKNGYRVRIYQVRRIYMGKSGRQCFFRLTKKWRNEQNRITLGSKRHGPQVHC